LALLVSALLTGGINDSLQTFPIGFWNYASIEVFDEAKVQEWQDAGMTLTMGPNFRPTPENIARMKDILRWSHARGIKVIVCDPRTHAGPTLPENYAEQVNQAYRDFGNFPATFGFHVLDEPGVAEFEATCAAVRTIRQNAPLATPFVNLLPWYEGVGERVGYDNWQTYLDDFLAKSGMPFLCYDCYAQMNPEQQGWPTYFRNLVEYREAAKRNGVPFWTTILSVGHFHYKCPTEDDIRWQFNSAVAYGAQGILYFFFYMRQPHDNYRLAPIDEFWDRTPLFDSLKRTNKGFIKRYGRLFLDLDLQKAMQFPEPVAGCLPFEPDDVVAAVRTDANRPVIVSRFADKQGRPWIAVVNNSTEESTHATLVFRGANTTAYQHAWSGDEVQTGTQPAPDVPDCVTVSHWLAPGQMEVYRVQQ
jgi:hypothetical protein